jgi:hypothetical protein
MFEEKSGMVMWREWRTTVSQRSLEGSAQPRQAEETEGKSQRSSLALNSGRTGISLQRRLRRRSIFILLHPPQILHSSQSDSVAR